MSMDEEKEVTPDEGAVEETAAEETKEGAA